LTVRRASSFTLAALALSGCNAGPDHVRPPAPASRALEEGPFLRAGEADMAAPLARWWQGLGDAELARLIERGLVQAPAVAAAEARLRQARAGLAARRAGQLPGLGTSLLYANASLPEDSIGGSNGQIGLFNAGFDAQWELDLWGGKRRDGQRARAEAEAAGARLADAHVTLSAEIARTCVALRARQASHRLIAEKLALHRRLTAIARQRLAAGAAPRQAVEAASAAEARGEAELAQAAADLTVIADGLAVLIGEAPGALDALAAGPVPLPPASVAVGDPAAMLARRPDIRAAERMLAAASARIGIERARRFPSVTFIGLIGIGGSQAGDLFDTANLSTIAVPRLSWSFLDFGRGAAAVRGSEAARDVALAEYRGQVLAALQDAEAALARFGAARIAQARAGSAAAHAGEIARLDALRARAGTLAPAAALQSEAQAIDARLAEAGARGELTAAYVALAKALGLGWEQDAG
jgi:NodT family efflux transporter outer membrane factor (OMF) lipoprotein